MKRLDEIEQRAAAATEGPWRVDRWEDFYGKEVTYSISGDTSVAKDLDDERGVAFIAAARQAVRDMADVLDPDLRREHLGSMTPAMVRAAIAAALDGAK